MQDTDQNFDKKVKQITDRLEGDPVYQGLNENLENNPLYKSIRRDVDMGYETKYDGKDKLLNNLKNNSRFRQATEDAISQSGWEEVYGSRYKGGSLRPEFVSFTQGMVPDPKTGRKLPLNDRAKEIFKDRYYPEYDRMLKERALDIFLQQNPTYFTPESVQSALQDKLEPEKIEKINSEIEEIEKDNKEKDTAKDDKSLESSGQEPYDEGENKTTEEADKKEILTEDVETQIQAGTPPLPSSGGSSGKKSPTSKAEKDPDVRMYQQNIIAETTRDMDDILSGKKGVDAQRQAEENFLTTWNDNYKKISARQWGEFVEEFPGKADEYKNDYAPIAAAISIQSLAPTERMAGLEGFNWSEAYAENAGITSPSALITAGYEVQQIPNQIAQELINKAVNKGKQKVVSELEKKFGKKLVEEGGKQVAQQAGKTIAKEVVVKGGAKLATKTALKEVISDAVAAAGIETGPLALVLKAITWIVLEILERIGKLLINLAKKTKDFLVDHPEQALTAALILSGVGLGSPLLIAGGVGAGLLFFFASYLFSIVIISATILAGSFIFVTIVVILITQIIHRGAYIVPEGGFTPPGAGLVGSESEYIRVEKTANPPSGPNDTEIVASYTIVITAKLGSLDNISITDECRILQEAGSSNCPTVRNIRAGYQSGQMLDYPSFQAAIPDIITPTDPYIITFEIVYNSGNGSAHNDALATNSFSVTASASGAVSTATGAANVIIGNPPTGCFEITDAALTWPANYRANMESATTMLSSQHPIFASKVCSAGTVTLCYDPPSVSDWAWGWHTHDSVCDVRFESGGLRTQQNALYILTHEVSHHIQHVMGSQTTLYLNALAANPAMANELPFCTDDRTERSETFAENNALYVRTPSYYCGGSQQSNYPLHYQFARDVIFQE